MLPGGFVVSLRETLRTWVRQLTCRKHAPLNKGFGITVCTRCGKVMFNLPSVPPPARR